MCGINGILVKDTKPDLLNDLKAMNDILIHRGPDGEGCFIADRVAFGHRRLSIIDLSGNAKQPMHFLDRYVITYNGEIFNYIELRDELIGKGYRFNTLSDTEVVMAAYDMWGAECLKRFNGMWAFVIFDRKLDKVFIGRDRFGIKPLYYYRDNSKFIFSSEIKAILAHKDITATANEEYCVLFAESGSREWIEETAFLNIYRFLQAHYIECNLSDLFGKSLTFRQYWSLETNLSREKFTYQKSLEYAAKYHALIKDSVRLRLRADVKVGSALSGGIDSSTIVKMVNECLLDQNNHYDNQLTFSSIYTSSADVKYCDESEHIKTLSDFLNVRSFVTEPPFDEITDTYSKISYHMDTPHEGSLLSAWYVYKLAAQNGVKVTLDGQGADEQLGGYWSYAKLFVADASNPFKGYFQMSGNPGIRPYINQGLIIGIMRKSLSKSRLELLFDKYSLNKIYLKSLNEKLVTDTLESLTHHLHFGDRLSMAHSVESRVPFLDYRFVEFAASVPACFKIHDGWTKHIARVAMLNLLPDNILWRRDKLGFPVPEDYWFRGPLKSWIMNEIRSSEFLKKLGLSDVPFDSVHISRLVRLLSLATWHKTFINRVR
jgi:asparagine synthase (glutamine-hydrolysing)